MKIARRTYDIAGPLIILAVFGLALFIAVVAADRIVRPNSGRKRADDFACGYSAGTKDAVIFVVPALGARPEFQVPKHCAELEEIAHAHGVVRIIPWLRGPVQ